MVESLYSFHGKYHLLIANKIWEIASKRIYRVDILWESLKRAVWSIQERMEFKSFPTLLDCQNEYLMYWLDLTIDIEKYMFNDQSWKSDNNYLLTGEKVTLFYQNELEVS